jgi:hypothetical protein
MATVSNHMDFYDMLRNDQHDRERAAKFDELLPTLSEEIRHVLEYNARKLAEEYKETEEYNETMAKSWLFGYLQLITAEPLVQDEMIRHGETVRAAYEWESVNRQRMFQ